MPKRRGSFERLQARFDTIPITMAEDDMEGYVFLCDVILQEEGWEEAEYLAEVLRRVG